MKHNEGNEQISHAANLRSSAFICGFFFIRLAEKYSSISKIFQSVLIRVDAIMANRAMKKFCNSGAEFMNEGKRTQRVEAPRRSTRMTRIKRMFTDPCKSAPSAKSAFYRSDSRTKSTDGKVSAYICVHPRFFYDVTFQGVEV